MGYSTVVRGYLLELGNQLGEIPLHPLFDHAVVDVWMCAYRLPPSTRTK